jgi:hypothetical protein
MNRGKITGGLAAQETSVADLTAAAGGLT